MIFVALAEAAEKGELVLLEGGMCRWHRRRDGVVVIREILVLPSVRRKGIGRALIQAVYASQGNGDRVVQAKCPAKYGSNYFWQAMGFTLLSETKGINLWQRPSHP